MASPVPPWEDLILLGHITRTQGHRGAVRMRPEFDPIDQIEDLKSDELILKLPAASAGAPGPASAPRPAHIRTRVLHLAEFSYHQQNVILTLAEIEDMTAAEHLRGAEVYVRQEHLWDLEPGQFFAYEVVGFKVVETGTGRVLGTVRTIEDGAGHDFISVRREGKKHDMMVPLVKHMVLSVDKAAQTIEVSIPEGLEDL